MMKQLLGVIASAGAGGGAGPGPVGDYPVLESHNTHFEPATNPGSVAVTKPSGVAVGDLLLFVVGDADTTASDLWTAPSGFTDAGYWGTAVSDCHISIFWRIADGTEGASASASCSNTAVDIGAIYARISNVDQTVPIAVVGAAAIIGDSTVDAPSITTTSDNNLALTFVARDGLEAASWSVNNSFTEVSQLFFDTSSASAELVWAQKDIASAGAIGVTTWTAGPNEGMLALQIAIQPPQTLADATTFTIPSGTVGSDLTDFPINVDLSRMPDAWWAGIDDDGGNIRVYQSDGTTLIPHDVTYINTTLKLGRLFAKHTVSAASDTVIVIGGLTPGTAKLAVGDTNGQYAVWADYDIVMVFPDTQNRCDGDTATNVSGTEYGAWEWQETAVLNVTDLSQGAAYDGTDFYSVSTNRLARINSAGVDQATNTDPAGDVNTDQSILNLDHCGAPDIIDGELWVPVQEYPATPYDSQFIGKFNLSTMAFIDAVELTGATREASGLCYDATNDRLMVTDYTDGTTIPYYDKTTGVYEGAITLSETLDNPQGISMHNGKYYVNCSTAGSDAGVWEVETDGTVNGKVLQDWYAGDHESVFMYDGKMYVGKDNSVIRTFEQVRTDWMRIHGDAIAHDVTTGTLWTTAVSWSPTPTINQQGIIGVYNTANTLNRHSLMFDAGPDVIDAWSPLDSWFPTGSTTDPADFSVHRAALGQNGSTARKLYVDGVLEDTDTPASAYPTSGTQLRMAVAGGASTEYGYGSYQYAWLRKEYMSDDWMEADYKTMHDETFGYVDGSYTEWRVLVDEPSAPAYLSIQEIEMAGSAAGPNLCSGGTASAGVARAGWTASEAFDGDKTTTNHGWSVDLGVSTDKSLHWIKYAFTSPVKIEELRMFARPDHPLHMPASFRLQYNHPTDGWTTKWNVQYEAFWTDSEERAFVGNSNRRTSGAARYWRVWGPDSENAIYVHIAELEFRESHGGADVTTTGFAISGAERGGSFLDTYAFDNVVSGNNSWGVQVSLHSMVDRWVGQDFGVANDKDVVEIEMTARADSFPTQNPYCFYVEQSDDGTTWTPVWLVSNAGGTWTSSEARVFRSPWAADELRLIGENGTDGAQDTTDQSPASTTLTWGGGSEVTVDEALPGQTLSVGINADTLSGDTLTIPAIDFGSASTDDFTIELWFYSTDFDATFYHALIGNGDNSTAGSWTMFVRDDANNYLDFRCQGGAVLVGTTDIALNTWNHAAIVRDGDDWHLYLNGVQQATHTDAARSMYGAAAGAIHIGGNQAGANDEWRGYVDKVRITKGFCRYPGGFSFVPPEYVG